MSPPPLSLSLSLLQHLSDLLQQQQQPSVRKHERSATCLSASRWTQLLQIILHHASRQTRMQSLLGVHLLSASHGTSPGRLSPLTTTLKAYFSQRRQLLGLQGGAVIVIPEPNQSVL